MGVPEDLNKEVSYLLEHAHLQWKNVNKLSVKQAVQKIVEYSQNGLPCEVIETLADNVVFADADAYDVKTRRDLLFSFIPVAHDFPYRIVTVAVSSLQDHRGRMWHIGVLGWLAGLLEYEVIDATNPYVHICFSTVFSLIKNIKYCPYACKILHYITQREDVMRGCIMIIQNQKTKHGFSAYMSSLLRLFHIFRPDMVPPQFVGRCSFPQGSKIMKEALWNARMRIQEQNEVQPAKSGNMWLQHRTAEKVNPLKRFTPVPNAVSYVYPVSLEEQKEERINVMQYVNIKQMIKHMHLWKRWKWPSSSSAILCKPQLVPLFLPHDTRVHVAICNWLELSLRVEVINRTKNPSPERIISLFRVMENLLRTAPEIGPAIFHFFTEFLLSWDGFFCLKEVLRVIRFLPFVSVEILPSLVEAFGKILTYAAVPLWCSVVRALGDMVSTWVLQINRRVDKNHNNTSVSNLEPGELDDRSSRAEGGDIISVGIFILLKELKKFFMYGLVHHEGHLDIQLTILDFYMQINEYCEMLEVHMFFCVPPVFTLMCVTQGNIVCCNYLGKLLVSMKRHLERVQTAGISVDKTLWPNSNEINISIILYLDALYKGNVLTEMWKHVMKPFVSENALHMAGALPNIQYSLSLMRSISYVSFLVSFVMEDEDYINSSTKRKDIAKEVLKKLGGMGGNIRMCIETYCQNE